MQRRRVTLFVGEIKKDEEKENFDSALACQKGLFCRELEARIYVSIYVALFLLDWLVFIGCEASRPMSSWNFRRGQNFIAGLSLVATL